MKNNIKDSYWVIDLKSEIAINLKDEKELNNYLNKNPICYIFLYEPTLEEIKCIINFRKIKNE